VDDHPWKHSQWIGRRPAARSREVRPKVRSVERLHAVVRVDDREGVLQALHAVVPGFTPTAVAAPRGVTPSGSR
jgi:hypothetical protein